MIKFQVSLFFVMTGIITGNTVLISSDFNNVLRDINDQLLVIVDDVFISLKINVNFTKSENVVDGLLLNNFIRNVSARNYKKYDKMYNLSKIAIDDNKTAYFIFIINEMIEELLMQERKKLKPHINVKYYKNNLMKSNSTHLFSEKNITFDLVKLKNEFNSKVDKSIIKDIVYKLLFANPKKSLTRPEEQDLKFWGFNISSLQTRRVFNGQVTSVKEFPFMVSVHIEGRFCCAGSIIRKEFVITAASCLRPFHTTQKIPHITLEVRVASNFTSQYGQLVPVAEMHFHPHFNHESLNNNLVILKLKKRLKFNDKVRKIMFDDKAYKIPENAENILILGWGSTNMKEQHQVETAPLSYAFVDVYNLQECKNVYSSFYVKDKNFCTGYVSIGSGACKNDIGGPAVVGSTLTGVISYSSPRCGKPDAPTVFTKLGYYADWINSVLDEIPQENNDIQPKSRIASQPRNLMTHSESVENPNNINTEIETLAQLIGELQVVKHINSTLTEILREKTKENNINTTTDKEDLPSKEKDNDVINVVNVLQFFSQDSVSTTPKSITIPAEAFDYEYTQNDEGAVSSKESEEVTTHNDIYRDLNEQLISGHLDSKSSPPKFTILAEGDEFTKLDEWPRTRFDSELLREMTISDGTKSHFDIDANSEYKSSELITTPNLDELETSNAPKSGRAEQDQLLEIVFLKSTPMTRFSEKDPPSVKDTTLPRNLPLIYYESSSTRKSFRKPVKSKSNSRTEGSITSIPSLTGQERI